MSFFHLNGFFPLIKGFEVQNFESVLCHKHKLTCFMLVARDERKKSEANFEIDYVLDSFMDKNTNLMYIFLNLNGTNCC